ncbi:cytochrome P450 2J2 [Aspergillus udagawae]|uniref:Cytochrome P450 2J2 n=1 Tax=Aspergillus udagawae TaxID=91492 RepID=A0ABQ1A7K1_9EURO|nr:cytochrome P450 2J2 [Aspergillus udagawae]GFF75413.1 cytochrome P450 2J2 [Aspergillus udagawae]GFG01629.1 cytochrome P450 2J2 [Aspergillus udagawae]GFG21564.1 cytochrome P450 2J2 [Aspergillus udagawae]
MDSQYIYGYAPGVLLPGTIALTVVVGYLAAKLLRIGARPKNFPPGPATELIWGNLKQYQCTKWAKSYGPVYTVMLGDTAHVVVSGLQEACGIFIKQGANSQARPPSLFQLLMRDG